MDLPELIRRLEACPAEGDPELDCHVLIATSAIQDALVVRLHDGDDPDAPVRWKVLRLHRPEPIGDEAPRMAQFAAYYEAPAYTLSIDAAAGLMGDRPWLLLHPRPWSSSMTAHLPAAWCPADSASGAPDDPHPAMPVYAANLAIALTLLALCSPKPPSPP